MGDPPNAINGNQGNQTLDPTKMTVGEQVYWKQREAYILRENEVADLFDKTLLTVSTLALGTSLAFLKDIGGSAPPFAKVLHLASWFLLGTSIVLSLASIFCSQWSHNRFVVIHDEKRKWEIGQRAALSEDEESNTYCGRANSYNKWSLAVLILGLLALFIALAATPWKDGA